MTDPEDMDEISAQVIDIEEAYDTSDAKKVGKKTRQDKQAQRLRDEGFKELIASPTCRAWLWNLLSEANVFSSTFSQEPTVYGLQEGKRSMGLMVMADITRLCPEMLATMMRENQNKAYG